MDILSLIGGIFKPVGDLIDNLHTSEEEKLKAKEEMYRIQVVASSKVLEYEKELMNKQADIVKAEAQGASWIQRNWRPITMLTFLVLVVCDSFGLLEFRLSKDAWTLLKIGLGGYVVGRSAEKIAPAVTQVFNKK